MKDGQNAATGTITSSDQCWRVKSSTEIRSRFPWEQQVKIASEPFSADAFVASNLNAAGC